eukprot:m.254427 g.254427  ORF g.254427 m.254427 type:complete len:253 (+) comp15493_c5_seq51:183-941(+)
MAGLDDPGGDEPPSEAGAGTQAQAQAQEQGQRQEQEPEQEPKQPDKQGEGESEEAEKSNEVIGNPASLHSNGSTANSVIDVADRSETTSTLEPIDTGSAPSATPPATQSGVSLRPRSTLKAPTKFTESAVEPAQPQQPQVQEAKQSKKQAISKAQKGKAPYHSIRGVLLRLNHDPLSCTHLLTRTHSLSCMTCDSHCKSCGAAHARACIDKRVFEGWQSLKQKAKIPNKATFSVQSNTSNQIKIKTKIKSKR